jgi:hypothetical protein
VQLNAYGPFKSKLRPNYAAKPRRKLHGTVSYLVRVPKEAKWIGAGAGLRGMPQNRQNLLKNAQKLER